MTRTKHNLGIASLDARYVNVTGDTMFGALIINVNSATALLVEQDGVKDNVLVVDTANGRIGINMAPTVPLDITGQIKTSVGLISPYVRPSADSTTAIQLQTSGGVSVLNVDTTNSRVGIGTTGPDTKLSVWGTTTQLKLAYGASNYVTGLVGSDGTTTFVNSGGDFNLYTGAASGAIFRLGSQTGDGGQLRVRSNSKDIAVLGDSGAANDGMLALFNSDGTTCNVFIRSNGTSYINGGNVGIGTTGPISKLQIQNGDNQNGSLGITQLALSYNTGGYAHFIRTRHNSSAANNAIDFYTSDGTQNGVFPTNAVLGLSINNGNVGIGTTGPGNKLSVATGNVGLDQGYSIGDQTYPSQGFFPKFDTAYSGVINSYGGLYFNIDADNNSTAQVFQIGVNNTGVSGTPLVTVQESGNVGIGTTSPTISDGTGLHLAGKILRIGTSKTPAGNGAGNAGEICWDSDFLYVCVTTNSWRRVALSAF